tara:strand:+ start:73 stop:381 length:309 start_codon:yes stop_codon:yes gene_type:complete
MGGTCNKKQRNKRVNENYYFLLQWKGMRNDKGVMPDAKKCLGEELTAKKQVSVVLMAFQHSVGRHPKSALESGGKISGVAITARMGSLLHTITTLQIVICLG